jgi:hypothetical protein
MTILSAEMNGAAKSFRVPCASPWGYFLFLATVRASAERPRLRECLCFREEAAGYGRDERPSVHHSIT